jgi:predicted amidophosphoribosyltransferase
MQLINSVLDFVYPPLCIHCNSFLEKDHLLLCSLCFQELGIQDAGERCHSCFSPIDQPHRCPKNFLNGLFACAPDSAALQTLLFSHPAALASLLFYQWSLLSWPTPDVMTITPGNVHVDLLCNVRHKAAKELSIYTHIPFFAPPILFQENLSNPFIALENQSKPQDPRCFMFLSPHHFINKKVLVIHDVLRTTIALSDTANALKQIGALEVYGLCISYE